MFLNHFKTKNLLFNFGDRENSNKGPSIHIEITIVCRSIFQDELQLD